MSIFELFQWFSHVFQEEWSKFKLWAWKCRFKYKPLQEGEILLPVSQKTSIWHSFPLCLSSHVSCFLHGPGSVQQWQRGEGAEEGDSPSLLASLLPAPLPSRSHRKMSVFLLMLQQRCPSCSFRANSWAPTWGPLCFALIIMPQPVTLMGKGQAPRQTGGDISQHPLPALGILSHLENAIKNKKRKWTKWSLTITLLREISVNTSELIPLLHIKLWYYCMCYYIWP